MIVKYFFEALMTDPKRPKGAQAGNTNAQKNDEPADSFLHIRAHRPAKAHWVRFAKTRGGLSEWVTKTLNEASSYDPDKSK